MTRLLYLEVPKQLTAQATVTEIQPEGEFLHVVLDQTPFYPEGGGQPSDLGQIGECQVLDVQIEAGVVKHKVASDAKFTVGQTLLCQVDVLRRGDLTCQHTAQHLLSATAYHMFEAKTVGFHLSEDYTTIDLDQKLSEEQLKMLVAEVFQRISENLPVVALFPDEDTLAQMPLRKMPKVEDNIRVVTVGTYDYSPCGGTHLDHTGQILGLKITKTEVYKGGTRITFVAGERFLKTLHAQQSILDQLALKLSSPVDQLVESFDQREAAFGEVKQKLSEVTETLLSLELDHWLVSLDETLALGSFTPLEIRQFEGRDLNELKRLGQLFVERQDHSAICLINRLAHLTQFILMRPKALNAINCKQILAEVAKSFETKGGGAPNGVQGSLVNPDETEAFIDQIELEYNKCLETN